MEMYLVLKSRCTGCRSSGEIMDWTGSKVLGLDN